MVQLDDVQVRENLTVEASPLQIEDHEVKHLGGNEIASMKVVWGGLAGGSVTLELESQMNESYPKLFPSCNFLGQKFYKWGRIVTPQIQLIYSIEFCCFNLLFKLFNMFNCLFDDNMWYEGFKGLL